MSKIIKLTESDVINIIKRVINEQWVYQPNKKGGYTLINGPYKGIEAKELFPLYSEKQYPKELDKNKNPTMKDGAPVPTMLTPKFQQEFSKLPFVKYGCAPSKEYSVAINEALNIKKIDPLFVKYGLGILGRESDYGKIVGNSWGKLGEYLPSKYAIKTPFEVIYNALPDGSPVKSIVNFAVSQYKKFTTGSNLSAEWVPSMGIGQMTPDVAKKYGVSMWQLLGATGALVATSSYLRDIYSELTNYDTNSPSIISINGKDVVNPSSTGNARLDAAIASYNLGSPKFKKTFCQSNDPNKSSKGLKTKCDSQDAIKDSVVKNYLPRYETKTGEGVLSSHGYLKEVSENGKKFTCI